MMAGIKSSSIWQISHEELTEQTTLYVHFTQQLNSFSRNLCCYLFQETLRVQIHANCRIRRVYFSDRLYSEEELPAEFKLYLPVQQKQAQQHGGMSLQQHHQQQQNTSKPETNDNALEMATSADV